MAANTRDWSDSATGEGSACGNFASSESLPGVCPDPQRQGALDAEHMSGPTRLDLCPDDPGLAGVPAALATALAADKRDRSI
jgi:hypothetical protein